MVLNVHILGSGNAARKHREAIEQLPDMYSISDYESADIIDVCTPPHVHYAEGRAPLKDGRSVIIEKPPAMSLAQMDSFIEQSIKYNRRVFPVFQYRPIYIRTMSASHWVRPSSYYEGWRGEWDFAGGGALFSHAIHDIDRAVFQRGMPVSVECELWFNNEPYSREVEWAALATLNYPDDRFVSIDCTVSDFGPEEHHANPGYIDFFKNLSNYTLEDARRTMEVVTACYYSAYTGEPVKLPLAFDHPFYSGWQEQMKQHQHRWVSSRKTPSSPDRLSA